MDADQDPEPNDVYMPEDLSTTSKITKILRGLTPEYTYTLKESPMAQHSQNNFCLVFVTKVETGEEIETKHICCKFCHLVYWKSSGGHLKRHRVKCTNKIEDEEPKKAKKRVLKVSRPVPDEDDLSSIMNILRILRGENLKYTGNLKPSNKMEHSINNFSLVFVTPIGSEDEIPTNLIACQNCLSVFKPRSGGHLKRHRKICSNSDETIMNEMNNGDTLTNFVLEQTQQFHALNDLEGLMDLSSLLQVKEEAKTPPPTLSDLFNFNIPSSSQVEETSKSPETDFSKIGNIVRIRAGNDPNYTFVLKASIYPNESRNNFSNLFLKKHGTDEEIATNFVSCQNCATVYAQTLRNSGHLMKHRIKCEDKLANPNGLKEDLAEMIFDGKLGIKLVENPAFMEYSMKLNKQFGDWPSLKQVRKAVEDLVERRYLQDIEMFTQLIADSQVTLVLDYEQEFLSIQLAFLVQEWKLRIVQIAFVNVGNGPRDAETTYNHVLSRFEQNGWTSEDLERCFLSSPYSPEMELLGQRYMSGYCRTGEEIAHQAVEDLSTPSDPSFTPEELEELKNVDRIMEAACRIVQKCGSSWDKLSYVNQVYEKLPSLEDSEDLSVLKENLTMVHALVDIFNSVKEKKDSALLRQVYFDICEMRVTLAMMAESQDSKRSLIGRSGLCSITRLVEQFPGFHFAMLRLCPMTKRMEKFQEIAPKVDMVTVADQEIARISMMLEEAYQKVHGPPVKKVKVNFFEDSDSDEEEQRTAQMRCFLKAKRDVAEVFWPANRDGYRRLFLVANKLFTLPYTGRKVDRNVDVVRDVLGGDPSPSLVEKAIVVMANRE